MSENPIIVVDKRMLNGYPDLQGKLNALCEQMYEEEDVYTYLPQPGYAQTFLELLNERNIRYSLLGHRPSAGRDPE